MELAYSRTDEPHGDRWDDFRFFLAVAKSASLKRAAHALGTTQSAVSKRIDRLEHSLGTRLFDRGATGTKLTYQGERILPHALAAQRELGMAQSEAHDADSRIEGDCSILLSDGIATYWVSRFLSSFYELYPNIELRMILGSDLAAPHNEIFDIRLHYFEPVPSEQIAKPLATVHFLPFASRSYVDRYGLPATREDLKHHRVLDSAQYLTSASSWSSWFGPEIDKNISLFTNQSAFLARCVANGAGIALMPSYMTLSETEIVPIEVGLRFKTKLFVTYHRERALQHPVKATLAFLRNAVFDPKTMPWFADEYIAPAKGWRDSFQRAAVNAQAPKLHLLEAKRG